MRVPVIIQARWQWPSLIGAVALAIGAAASVYSVTRAVDRSREDDRAVRAKCLAYGGRIVPVYGGKYSAWICDLPRNVEVQP